MKVAKGGSADRLSKEENIRYFPVEVIKAFRNAEPPCNSIEYLWREVFARAVLDALGFTGLAGEPDDHDRAVKEARRWFRGIPDINYSKTICDYAGMAVYGHDIAKAILNQEVVYMLDKDEDDLEQEMDERFTEDDP